MLENSGVEVRERSALIHSMQLEGLPCRFCPGGGAVSEWEENCRKPHIAGNHMLQDSYFFGCAGVSSFPFEEFPTDCTSRAVERAPVLMRTWTSTGSSPTSSGKGGNG